MSLLKLLTLTCRRKTETDYIFFLTLLDLGYSQNHNKFEKGSFINQSLETVIEIFNA